MKQYLYSNYLKFTKEIAKVIQIGNPKHRAPALGNTLIESDASCIPCSEIDELKIWELFEVVCTANQGGAIINKQNEVYPELISFAWGKHFHPTLAFPYLGSKRIHLESAIFLITPEAKGNYYHWIIDLFPRLLLIKKYAPDILRTNSIILHWPDKKYENDTIAALGVTPGQIIRLKTFEFAFVEKVIATNLMAHGSEFPEWKKKLLDEFKAASIGFTTKQNRKIYLRRGKQKKRCLIGEDVLVEKLKLSGFEIIDLEQLSFIHQMETLDSSAIVVALHGAALTNIVFCKQNTRIIELRSTNHPPEFYAVIAKAYNFLFETIGLMPMRNEKRIHKANKQNLVLTNADISIILSKIQTV